MKAGGQQQHERDQNFVLSPTTCLSALQLQLMIFGKILLSLWRSFLRPPVEMSWFDLSTPARADFLHGGWGKNPPGPSFSSFWFDTVFCNPVILRHLSGATVDKLIFLILFEAGGR
ncbi:MAG: hypothetical protein ACXV5J_00030 [Candidatus Angelobacter sp.]